MPRADNGASVAGTPAVLNLLQSQRHVHLHTLRVSVGEILHVGALIQGYYGSTSPASAPGAAIVVDDIDDGFNQICALAAHITGEQAGRVSSYISSFSRVTIMRGSKPPSVCRDKTAYNTALNAATCALWTVLSRICQSMSGARVIWHSHADPTFLAHILQTTKKPAIDAITVFDALSFLQNAIRLPQPIERKYGFPSPWPIILNKTKSHNISLVFASSGSMRTQLNAYGSPLILGVRNHFPVLLPESIWKCALGEAMDSLLVGVFRLLAGGDLSASSPKRTGSTVVAEVKRRLNARLGRGWAKSCVNDRSYTQQAIVATVQGALPGSLCSPDPVLRLDPNAPFPTLAALTQMIVSPSPSSSASAISRLAMGPHAAPFTNASSANNGPTSACQWAVRAVIAPRNPPLPPNTPSESVIVQIVPNGSNVHVLTSAQPQSIQNAVSGRWAGYVGSMQRRERQYPASSGGGSNGFGVSKETARVWCAVVPGIAAVAVEEWGRKVVGKLRGAEKAKFEREVGVLLQAARECSFTKRCQRVLKG
ncbi:hypothetical protein B0J12DRAFT_737487 [Macrophomina phaseolina]|uniref:Uncharacterized protein n=1 Tax=Macrophomina phaseolina TaxID=35725 RepID=A0ABQ8GKE2_9PEZI|nr:hypothetical protein B0J12DRAFT_737487 [Macrophomina phaseolina]